MFPARKTKSLSPIVEAIRAAESGTTAEIRVHLSRLFFERDAYARAGRLFRHYSMHRTAQRNAILVYVNLRRRKFAILGDEGVHSAVGQRYWEELARELKHGFISTHPENAISDVVKKLGAKLAKHFPTDPADGSRQ